MDERLIQNMNEISDPITIQEVHMSKHFKIDPMYFFYYLSLLWSQWEVCVLQAGMTWQELGLGGTL